MKKIVHRTEYYPFYDLGSNEVNDVEVDIPEDKVLWIEKVLKELEEVQDYLGDLHEKASFE